MFDEEEVELWEGIDGTKMCMEKSDPCLCCKISFPNSTMETKWANLGAGYNTIVSFIFRDIWRERFEEEDEELEVKYLFWQKNQLWETNNSEVIKMSNILDKKKIGWVI